MDDSLGRILSTVERITFSLIALYIAVFLINFSVKVAPQGYGEQLLSGLSVIFAIGGIFLFFLVVVNFINLALSTQKKRG